ncbi:MAG: hypothetical protein ACQEP7_05555 [bacterium]
MNKKFNVHLSGWAKLTLSLFLITSVFLSGCVATGRGEFPPFNYEKTEKQTLAVVHPLGYASNDLRGTILSQLNREILRDKFKTVKFVPDETIKEVLGENYSGERVSQQQGQELAQATGADLILGFWIHDFVVERFSTTETRTLYTTNTRYRNTSIHSAENETESENGKAKGKEKRKSKDDNSKSEDTYISTMESKTRSRQIPVNEAQNRVVISLTALIYDVDQKQVIWRGKRIERAEASVSERSTVELIDIAVSRIMSRIHNKIKL